VVVAAGWWWWRWWRRRRHEWIAQVMPQYAASDSADSRSRERACNHSEREPSFPVLLSPTA